MPLYFRTFLSGMLIVLIFLFFGIQKSVAETYQVNGVESWDVLYIRSHPSSSGNKIGSIPPHGKGIEKLGSCRGDWCKIKYRGTVGWSSLKYLVSEPSKGSRNASNGGITLLGESWIPNHTQKPAPNVNRQTGNSSYQNAYTGETRQYPQGSNIVDKHVLSELRDRQIKLEYSPQATNALSQLAADILRNKQSAPTLTQQDEDEIRRYVNAAIAQQSLNEKPVIDQRVLSQLQHHQKKLGLSPNAANALSQLAADVIRNKQAAPMLSPQEEAELRRTIDTAIGW